VGSLIVRQVDPSRLSRGAFEGQRPLRDPRRPCEKAAPLRLKDIHPTRKPRIALRWRGPRALRPGGRAASVRDRVTAEQGPAPEPTESPARRGAEMRGEPAAAGDPQGGSVDRAVGDPEAWSAQGSAGRGAGVASAAWRTRW